MKIEYDSDLLVAQVLFMMAISNGVSHAIAHTYSNVWVTLSVSGASGSLIMIIWILHSIAKRERREFNA